MNVRPSPNDFGSTLVDLLQKRAVGRCANRGFTFFQGDEVEDHWLRYRDLDLAAKQLATRLARQPGRVQDSQSVVDSTIPRAVILCPPGPEYLKALFGVMYAGMIAVTAYPPRARRRDERLDRVIEDSGATIALVDRSLYARREQIFRVSPSLRQLDWVQVDEVESKGANAVVPTWTPPSISVDDLAMLQYTSGSTSQPRGVCLTHGNLIANLEMIYELFEVARHDEQWCVTWLPPYHDMGLIGGLFQVMYAGFSTHVMPPAAFVQKPIRWLRAITKYRANVSGGPNFAYDTCVDRITKSERELLDLSSWSLAFTGAEPIRNRTLQRFVREFAPHGFRDSAFFPCYGLAEATLIVSGGPRDSVWRVDHLSEPSNESSESESSTRSSVCCGKISRELEVRVVDPETECELGDGEVGEIWVAGASVSPGYWQNESATQEVFQHRLAGQPFSFLRTGDLGYRRGDELFVCGRLKELIVVRGRNFHPADIETAIADCHPLLHANVAAAIEIEDASGIGLAVVQEVDRGAGVDAFLEAVHAIRRCIVSKFDLQPDRIALIPKRSLPRTSSGKVQRLVVQQRAMNGTLEELPGSYCRPAGATPPRSIATPGDRPRESGEASFEIPALQHADEAAFPVQPARRRTKEEITNWLADRLARQLHIERQEIDRNRPFVQYGLDSVSAVQITGELESFLGQSIPATLFYEAPTIAAVGERLSCDTTVREPAIRAESLENDTPFTDRAAGNSETKRTGKEVAIIGIACRLPGCETVDSFWKLLRLGKSAVSAPPANRADCVSRNATTNFAGWIDDPSLFDATLFGISPREARCMDPQHRLLLETSWRSLEDAALDPKRLSGDRVGVFVGISNRDYERRLTNSSDQRSTYAMTGNAASMAAHRLSYHFDLHGPSMAVDTACSSSLVALHQAVRSLQASDCEMAIVGGVNLILSPELSETLSDAEMLARDGICKTFDAEADGYGRGEGCISVVLKPLQRAIEDGDPIRAVIHGTAINQDGTTNGITAPNGDSQMRLYRDALADAELDVGDVTRLEAHGTGTVLGDPIEVRSLDTVYGIATETQHDRADAVKPGHRPAEVGGVHLGAVKANIGHLEAAAGLAGLLKVVLELQHRVVVPQPHFYRLNPHIDLTASRLTIPTSPQVWNVPHRLAAVSSFGFGGTNAHVIVGEYMGESKSVSALDRRVKSSHCLVPLSAADSESLEQTVVEHAAILRQADSIELPAFATAVQRRKTSHRHRLAVVGDSVESVHRSLEEAVANEGQAWRGVAPTDRKLSIAFMFSGQGGQYVGMGQGLYSRVAVFREQVDHCDTLLREEFGYGIRELIDSNPGTNGAVARLLEGPGAQTGLFTLQRALAITFQRWGIDPDAVLGHSMGEYAAAAIAGTMDWDDALRLTAARAKAIGELTAQGSMAVVFDSVQAVQEHLATCGNSLSVAAIDGPQHVVVSGPRDEIETLSQRFRDAGTSMRPLRIAQAFHSRLIEPALESIERTLSGFELKTPRLRYVSTLTGQLASAELCTANYWTRHSRQPVQFLAALKSLAELGCDLAVEIGPHPTLCTLGQLNSDVALNYRPTLVRQQDDWLSMLESIAELYSRGLDFDWKAFASPNTGTEIRLPGHPFHSKRYWFESDSSNDDTSQEWPRVEANAVIDHLSVKADPPRPSNGTLSPQDELRLYSDAVTVLDSLSAKYVCRAFAELGLAGGADCVIEPQRLIFDGVIHEKYRRLLERLCEILAEDGILEPMTPSGSEEKPNQWRVLRHFPADTEALETQVRELQKRHSVIQHELRLLDRCGMALASVLRGEQDALSILFPNGDSNDLEQLYRASPISKSSNRLLARSAEAIQELYGDQSGGMRVLEIGGGTGGATSAILPALKGKIQSYVFTDASPMLVAESASRFRESNIEFRVLDIESDPGDQGFEDEAYDLVIAANVLHATQRLDVALANTKGLLRPGGTLLALEGVRKERFLDLVFGLTEGWWHFHDIDLRSAYPLLSESQWMDVLSAGGFSEAKGLPFPEGEESVRACQAIWMAVRNGETGMDTVLPKRTAAPRSPMQAKTRNGTSLVTHARIEAYQLAEPAERRTALEDYFRESIASVLGHAAEDLDLDQPVSNLGIDSLMAIQLKNRLESDLGLSVPMIAFLQGKSTSQLIDVALSTAPESDERLGDGGDPPVMDQLPTSDTSPTVHSATPEAGTAEASVFASAPANVETLGSRQLGADHSDADHAALSDIVSKRSSDRIRFSDAVSFSDAVGTASAANQDEIQSRERVLGPMSMGQLALWMIHQRAPQGPAYNFAFAARTSGTIDRSAMTQACRSLVKRHPVLRTRYRWQGDAAVRVLSPSTDVVIHEKDCRDWKETRMLDWIREQADQPFDLQSGPVIRFSLLRCRHGDVLSIAMHHIAADLWSMDVLIQELIDLYAMILGGGSIDLGPLPTTYDAYVQWERELNQSDEGKRLWDFWREKLDGAPHVLNLPTTYPRPVEQSFQGQSLEWTLSSEVVDALREIAHSERTTMFTIVLAAYQVFLARICNQDDLLVGTVSASRGKSDWEGIVGYFLNQLVLRTRIVGAATFRDVLRDSQREVLDALDNQAYPFAELVENIRPDRDASRSPLIQTMFIWDKPRQLKESHFAPGKSSDRLRLKPLLMEQRGAPFDLTLIVFELEDELRLTFRYNTDLFSPQAIETLSSSLESLIEGVASDPDAPVRTQSLLTSEQEDLLESWNQTEYPFDPQLHGDAVFRSWAVNTPDAIAIETESVSLTYAEADSQAMRIAASLRRRGLCTGQTVGLWMERGAEAIVSILGIWRAGAAYLPLNPEYPLPRLQSILTNANPSMVLANDPETSRDLPCDCPVIDFSDAVRVGASAEEVNAFPELDPDLPAYMIYTSGSTGQPKGVVVRHRGVANLVAAQRRTFGITATDRCLQFASLSFDASVFELMMAFHSGATLFVVEPSVIRSTTSAISEALRRAGVTVATLPPAVLAAIPATGLPQLRTLISAGEACSASLVSKWQPGRQMFNAYGPTETTVWATTHRCQNDGLDPPLGRPIGNVRAYVVDERCELVPIGVAGELCLSGPGLAAEYHRLPESTADAFVPNPFDDRFDATLYRTGDRVRWNQEGSLEYLGRIDDQVKIGGHRIEPGEIANAIRRFRGVENACVTAREFDGETTLIAHVVASPISNQVDAVTIRHHLRGYLPGYMLPKHIMLIDQIPQTANGKVAVHQLPSPSRRRNAIAGVDKLGDATPLSETERELRDIWREVLHVDAIGVHDNFFELGGASLQALQAADVASKRGYALSAERMFQFQTIAELASEIDSLSADSSSAESLSAHSELTVNGIPNAAASGRLIDAPKQSVAMTTSSETFADRRRAVDPGEYTMVVESIGMYLPPATMTTDEVVAGCDRQLDFPLERMTGIESRHVAGRDEFSIDLARKAALDCLRHSHNQASEIDLLIAANISRYDGPEFQIAYEPSTASKLKQLIGAENAVAFDVCNACAGFFTALSVAQTRLLSGQTRRAMIVSGEYITHLTETAQREIDGFLDPRLACLTLGDAGVAVIVELADDGSGFQTLDLYTAGKHHDLCVAKATDRPHGGAIMLTDAIKASAVTLDHSVGHAHDVLKLHHWDPEEVRHLIMHQTSATTLDGAVEELNRHFGKSICGQHNTVNNLHRRGNTATTTHWVAVMDMIRQGRIGVGDKAVFAISGSGQTIGTALYRFDDLPDRILGERVSERRTLSSAESVKFGVRIKAAALRSSDQERFDSRCGLAVVESAAASAVICLQQAGWLPNQVEWLVHCGVYRDDFLSEPAVAAILAGELQMNEDRPGTSGTRTLAFDVSDGARGALMSCGMIADEIRAGKIERGMVTASELENNDSTLPQRQLWQSGSAIALERCPVGYGLGDFFFQSYPKCADALRTSTVMLEGKPRLMITSNPQAAKWFLDCVVDCVEKFQTRYRRSPGRYSKVLVSIPASVSRSLLAQRLGLSEEILEFPDISEIGSNGRSMNVDAFTSGLAVLWNHCREEAASGDIWLCVAAGAGIEVGCVEYRHE